MFYTFIGTRKIKVMDFQKGPLDVISSSFDRLFFQLPFLNHKVMIMPLSTTVRQTAAQSPVSPQR